MPGDKQEWLKRKCHEIRILPSGWIAKVGAKDSKYPLRIYFLREGSKLPEYCHPTLGRLPEPWTLMLCLGKGGDSVRYCNSKTKESIIEDPRNTCKEIKDRPKLENDDKRITDPETRITTKFALDETYRQDIGTKNILHQYDILHTIDPGDGTLGAMNGGLFIVKHKFSKQLLIEKRFRTKKPSDIASAKVELMMLHRLKHGALTLFVAGFITSQSPISASLYIEFCDRGSLQDLLSTYRLHRKDGIGPRVRERFIWHAFAGLCDGLAYLQGGRSYVAMHNSDYSKKDGWVSVLHRDVKPDNILLRSRNTLGKKCYFYCVLSDFGLACDGYPDTHPYANEYQKSGLKLGTQCFFAPELLYDPFPRNEDERNYFPKGGRHTAKSDLWALAASIYGLAYLDGKVASHIKMEYRKRCGVDDFMAGKCSRKEVLNVPISYSDELKKAILLGSQWRPEERPEPIEMLRVMKGLMRGSGYTKSEWEDESEEIPEWATKKHDFGKEK